MLPSPKFPFFRGTSTFSFTVNQSKIIDMIKELDLWDRRRGKVKVYRDMFSQVHKYFLFLCELMLILRKFVGFALNTVLWLKAIFVTLSPYILMFINIVWISRLISVYITCDLLHIFLYDTGRSYSYAVRQEVTTLRWSTFARKWEWLDCVSTTSLGDNWARRVTNVTS